MFKNIGDRVVIEFGTTQNHNFDNADQNQEGIYYEPSFNVSYMAANTFNPPRGDELIDLHKDKIDNISDALAYATYLAQNDEETDDLQSYEKEFKRLENDNAEMQQITKFLNLMCFAMINSRHGNLRLVFQKTSEHKLSIFFEMPLSQKVYDKLGKYYYEGTRRKLTGQVVKSSMSHGEFLGVTPLLLLSVLKNLIENSRVCTGYFVQPLKNAVHDITDYANRFNSYNMLSKQEIEDIYTKLENMGCSTTNLEGKQLSIRPTLKTRSLISNFINNDCTKAILPTADIQYLQSSLGLSVYQKDPIISHF